MSTKTLIGGGAVVAALAAVALFVFLTQPAPEEASIDNALTALDDATEGTGDAQTPASPETAEPTVAPLADVDGTWSVSTEIGDFSFTDATSSFVGFRVDEELVQVGRTEAVGRTPAVRGELTIEGTMLTAASIEADFSQLTTDRERRDRAALRAIGAEQFPIGTFTLTEPIDFGQIPAEGERISFTAVGDLTVNGMTNPVTVDAEGQVADGNILIVGQAPVVFADYGIEAPTAPIVASIEDNGTIEIQLWFTLA